MFKATNDAKYLLKASKIASAALERFRSTDNPSIIVDDCCLTALECSCDHDGISFHGILARSLSFYIEAGGDEDGEVQRKLLDNADTAWENRNDYDQFSISWFAKAETSLEHNDACVAEVAGLQLLTAASA